METILWCRDCSSSIDGMFKASHDGHTIDKFEKNSGEYKYILENGL